ncbi:MAG TPA: hypothetical protein PLF26_06580 [Blastocatellia bacterium]|nr:hypothetical protein [Blastocatellia bacterium]
MSILLVLSGLSKTAVYARSIRDGHTSVRFFIRRIIQIWPLMWLAVGAVTLGALLKARAIDWGWFFSTSQHRSAS